MMKPVMRPKVPRDRKEERERACSGSRSDRILVAGLYDAKKLKSRAGPGLRVDSGDEGSFTPTSGNGLGAGACEMGPSQAACRYGRIFPIADTSHDFCYQ
jgi:hypothetical protein